MANDEQVDPKLDTSVPHTARIWNYILGGKDNFEVDREVGEQVLAAQPELAGTPATAGPSCIRVVRYLAGEAGVRQFLDIGTGLPTANNTHEVAQSVAPESRIVYVDNDPLVLAHARALLTSTPEGVTDYLDADLFDTGPGAARSGPARSTSPSRSRCCSWASSATSRPTPRRRPSCATVLAAVPSGSYFSMCDSTDGTPEVVEAARVWNESAALPYYLRSEERIARVLRRSGATSNPASCRSTRWRPDTETHGIDQFGAVARKP